VREANLDYVADDRLREEVKQSLAARPVSPSDRTG